MCKKTPGQLALAKKKHDCTASCRVRSGQRAFIAVTVLTLGYVQLAHSGPGQHMAASVCTITCLPPVGVCALSGVALGD